LGGGWPGGTATPPVTLIDHQLFRFAEIWAAAGHPHGVFRLSPHELQSLTGAPVHDVTAPLAPLS
ncbi:MAG: hypothetical protein K0M67_06150, partial [Thiobacillus sp.]|nr:hypothetical protein [Thiobacillus sp.]